VTHLDRKQRLGIGHVRLGKMNPFGVFAKIINKGVRSKDVVPFQGAGEVLDAMPTKEQLEKFGNLPSEKELVEQGFDTSTFYHGSPEKNIREFVPQSSDRSVFGGYREARKGVPTTFFSEAPTYTEGFALKGGMPVNDKFGKQMYTLPKPSARIYPVKLKLDNVYDYNNAEHRKRLEEALGTTMEEGGEMGYNLKIGDAFILQQPEISGVIKQLGFRGYLTNETDRVGKRTVGLFYPEKGDVRSVFAQFDPKKADEGNIYASIIPPMATAVGVGALAGLEDAT
jgi:hypothetical protein